MEGTLIRPPCTESWKTLTSEAGSGAVCSVTSGRLTLINMRPSVAAEREHAKGALSDGIPTEIETRKETFITAIPNNNTVYFVASTHLTGRPDWPDQYVQLYQINEEGVSPVFWTGHLIEVTGLTVMGQSLFFYAFQPSLSLYSLYRYP